MIFAFSTFELDDDLFELRRRGVPVPIQRKTFDLLLYLVRSGGAVVTRQALMKDVWPSVVVAEPALTQAILTVRKAIEDDGESPAIVQTVRGRGYRFAASVETRDPKSSTRPPPARSSRESDPEESRPLPFVGRRLALGHLAGALADAHCGRGRIVLLLGDQGSGKTRLLDEMEARSTGEPRAALFLRGHAFPGAGAPPLWPWVQIRRRLAGAATAGAPDDEAVSAEERFRFADAVTRLVLDRAKDVPLVLVLEDVQWADPASFELLLLLAPQLPHSRVLVILTTRSALGKRGGPLGAIARLPITSAVDLDRLDRSEVAELVEALIGESAGAALIDRVLEKTGGNPSLIAQIAHVIARYTTNVGTSAMLHTGALREAIAQQVGDLAEPVREALTVAAVIGLSFELGPLALSLAMSNQAALALLDEAVTGGIVTGAVHDRGYRFTQPLVRDALYRRLPDGEQRKLHDRVARALLAFWGGDAASHASELAPHLVRAAPLGDIGAAIDYALRAALAAAARNDERSARRFVELAREALAHARPANETERWSARIAEAEEALRER